VQLDFAVAPVDARSRQFRTGCGQKARTGRRVSVNTSALCMPTSDVVHPTI
jgi:hypothetical protein